MVNLNSLRKETRYGMPAADQILFNRYYITGYSYYFRQPKWVLEIVNPPTIDGDKEGVKRSDNFRPDYRIPQLFRADLVDFAGSGYDRGHMVPSANQRGLEVQNSETFLLSNMSPQSGDLNRFAWRHLEKEIRVLNSKEDVLETYVITGPIFNFQEPIETIGSRDKNQVTIPVPHRYFKSILTEDKNGTLKMWSFILPNSKVTDSLSNYMVATTKVEQYAGIELWSLLTGIEMKKEKLIVRPYWS
ncbi:MAG: DNA/RNA non-specific endonuclease [Candidatus Pacebacteria bacterium]|nr:DNA/RNA non-specific endonuclease [Candidatus Paceibacterota bacterium]